MYVIRDDFMLRKVRSGLVEFFDFQYYLAPSSQKNTRSMIKKMSRFKITEIQQYLGEKSRDTLISMEEEADSLLKFIDKENKLLHKHFVHQDHQEQPSLIIQSTVLLL
jgi:hypothetical protein